MKLTRHDTELKRIEFLDNRYYTLDDVTFYPGSTTILEVYPKGFGFDQWLKDVGNNAAQIAERAADFGSKIHKLSERLDDGEEVRWEEGYTLEEWQAINKFARFHELVKPELIANEMSLCSAELRYGGTLDRVYKIAGKNWLIDLKTSNYIHKTHELQLASYAVLWNSKAKEQNWPLIDNVGILWLKAATRTEKVDAKVMQGMGWQVKTFERHYSEAFKIFQHVQRIWEEENPNYRPANYYYPDSIKLNGR